MLPALVRVALWRLHHRMAHWLRRHACSLEAHLDGWYLQCDVCGKATFYAPYPPGAGKHLHGTNDV